MTNESKSHPLFLLVALSTLLHFSLPADAFRNPDILVIGGGTAGCALASRLCALRPDKKVLLVERSPGVSAAGSFLIRSPRQMWNAWASPLVTEIFDTVPSNYTLGRPQGALTGNVLGGSSAWNGRQFLVPLRGNVESWGITGLTTDSSRTYYTRVFRTVGFDRQRVDLRQRYAEDYIAASEKSGYPLNGDPFDTRTLKTMFENRLAVDKDGFNVNSCNAYLTPALAGTCNRNLRLKQGVTVSRILLNERNNRAVGIEYVRTRDGNGGRRRTIFVKDQVISSAGPFGSPKLLQLSGIGPPAVLQQAGVPVRVNLPVGIRTQARNFASILAVYASELEPSNNSTLLNSAASRAQWERGDGGVLGVSSFFANGRDARRAYFTGTGSWFTALLDQKFLGWNCNGNTNSYGYLRITSRNPFASPKVDLALLKDPRDVTRLLKCLRTLVNIARNMPDAYNVSVVDPPNGDVTETFIRANAGWAGHFVAGCPVGSVLDSEASVRGVPNLKVIDASTLPSMTESAGPMASVYMLAEYMAELISSKI